MMKLTGRLEVFKNKNGYVTGVIKAWDDDSKKVLGKAFMDVNLPKDVEIKDGQSLTLDVEEAYLNAYFVDTENPFTKLKINVVKCKVIDVFPKEAKKASKKVSK